MKKNLLLFLLSTSFCAVAQDTCNELLLHAPGSWGMSSRSERVAQPALNLQRKFVDAASTMLDQGYKPQNVRVDRSFWHEPLQRTKPVSAYGLVLYAMQYSYKGNTLELNHETSTTLRITFNQFNDAEIYETSNDYLLTGFHHLSRGLPVEVKPGIWQFPPQRSALGFGLEGSSSLWLVTHDGKLPWSFVSRREFLLKRKQNLQRQMDEEAPRLKDQLSGWETQKKFKEQEYKNDPSKLSAYINSTYTPGVEREQENFRKAIDEWKKAIQFVDTQLQSPPAELSKPAIVIRNENNFRVYDFTEKAEPFAQILVKPNPDYFNRSLDASVPQMILIEAIANLKDPVAQRFYIDAQKAVNVDYLKSMIGKTTPGSIPTVNSHMMTVNANTIVESDQRANSSQQVKSDKVTTTTSSTTTSSTTTSSTTTSSTTAPSRPTNTEGVVASGKNTSDVPGKSYKLSGLLSAPAGSSVTIGYNGANDLTIAPEKTDRLHYKTIPFAFEKPVADGSTFNVEVKKAGSNTKSVVYRGKGNVPKETDRIRVAIDYSFDLITRSSDDKVKSSFYESFTPVIGGYNGEEGRYVVFVSSTKNFEGSDGKYRQVFWRDRNTGLTKLISRSSSGDQANADCIEPSISADGQSVVFESKATNLVSGSGTAMSIKNIFVWKAETNTIGLVSKSTTGAMADGESFDAMISGNGKFVVFTSVASNLSTTPKGRSDANIFINELQTGKSEMISVDPVAKSGGNGFKSSISFDGNRVTFCSATNTLVANDNNGLWDIFLWERGKPMLRRISMTHDGKERNAGVESASRRVSSTISGDGRFVAFATTASNMVPGDNNQFQDVFVIDVDNGKVSVASFNDEGQASNGDSPIEQGERIALSYDGTWVAFPTKATNLGVSPSNIVLHNVRTGKKQIVCDVKGTYVSRASMSYSGSYLVFGKASNLDNRFSEGGIFAHFTGNGPCRDCKE